MSCLTGLAHDFRQVKQPLGLDKSNMKLDQKLVDTAIQQALERFPEGYAGTAAVYTEDGQIITSVCFDTRNEVANLCHETGAYCEANRINKKVTASVCVSRATSEEAFIILVLWECKGCTHMWV